MSITLIIIVITVLVSVSAMNNDKIMGDLVFYPPAVTHQKQWYRFFTSGFLHADFMHLAFNMYGLYIFGKYVEEDFSRLFQQKGSIIYLLMYLSALFFCLLPTYAANKNNSSYRSLGASGAVSAVIFAFILLNPLIPMGILFIPVRIPGFAFGLLFLVISSYLDKKGGGNINHSAHIWGALYGIAFLIVVCYLLSDYQPLSSFITQIKYWFSTF
ncbi:MAG: rhomboid family intramembrane serine protease [Chitinophagaceae bacterium]|nr:MAG: rhomboid family intramembrane serine protease [Chitinophagaceae bacterium]